MKKVKNKAIPTNTWFGGICCVAKDVLTKERTMIILVKHVIKIRILGARDKTVSKSSSLTEVETDEGSEFENICTKSFMAFFLFLIRFNHLTSIFL